MRYRRISDNPYDRWDCPAVFGDRQDDRRAIVRGDLLSPTEEIALEEQERAVVVPALHVVAAAAELGGGFTRVDVWRMFQVFAVGAFRIETRDNYDVAAEAPAIAEFEATGRIVIYEGKQATLLRSIQHLVVPGLLQTRPYALALFQRAHPAGRDAEQAADARLARQRILDDQTRRFEWVITEAALWWRPADWAVQAEQIRAVATAATRPNVDLRVLPLDVQAPTFYHSFTLLDEQLVTADSIGEVLLSDPDDIAWQVDVFTRMRQAALDPVASRAVLDGLAVRFAAR